MRCRRAIRTALVFVLLGAVATVLTSWAIHAVQFRRAWAGRNQTILFVPSVPWPVEHDLAREHGINPTARDGEPAVDDAYWLWAFQDPAPPKAAGIDADGAWRRYRVRADRAPPIPDYPFPHALFEFGHPRFGWRVLHSWARIYSTTLLPPDHWTEESLFVVLAGWPRPALACGAHHAELVEDFPRAPGPGSSIIGHKSVSPLADQPKVSLTGGIELWRGTPVAPLRALNLPTSFHPLDRFALPLLPLWPGFLLNTMFYALLLFALVRGVRTVRRALRRRRGRCVVCGYSRDGLDPGAACPECGAQAGARMATGPAAAT